MFIYGWYDDFFVLCGEILVKYFDLECRFDCVCLWLLFINLSSEVRNSYSFVIGAFMRVVNDCVFD